MSLQWFIISCRRQRLPTTGSSDGSKGAPLPLFRLKKKKSQKEENPAGQAKPAKPPTHPTSLLARGLAWVRHCVAPHVLIFQTVPGNRAKWNLECPFLEFPSKNSSFHLDSCTGLTLILKSLLCRKVYFVWFYSGWTKESGEMQPSFLVVLCKHILIIKLKFFYVLSHCWLYCKIYYRNPVCHLTIRTKYQLTLTTSNSYH